MSYDTDVLSVLDVEEGYEKIADQYQSYHRWLDSFDKSEWRKFLPRDLKKTSILDLGAGDGRTYPLFEKCGYERYVALDLSPSLLKKHTGKDVECIVHDVSEPFPLENDTFDLVTSFFFLEHVEDLSLLMSEAYRVLAPGGRYILTYFPQRRAYIHRLGNKQFKIVSYAHRFEDIERAASDAFFSTDYLSLYDGKPEIGRAYCFTK